MKEVKIFLDDVREPQACANYMHLRIGAKTQFIYKIGK
jgi:hypothetical protein